MGRIISRVLCQEIPCHLPKFVEAMITKKKGALKYYPICLTLIIDHYERPHRQRVEAVQDLFKYYIVLAKSILLLTPIFHFNGLTINYYSLHGTTFPRSRSHKRKRARSRSGSTGRREEELLLLPHSQPSSRTHARAGAPARSKINCPLPARVGAGRKAAKGSSDGGVRRGTGTAAAGRPAAFSAPAHGHGRRQPEYCSCYLPAFVPCIALVASSLSLEP